MITCIMPIVVHHGKECRDKDDGGQYLKGEGEAESAHFP